MENHEKYLTIKRYLAKEIERIKTHRHLSTKQKEERVDHMNIQLLNLKLELKGLHDRV